MNFKNQLYVMLEQGKSYYKSASILYEEAQMRDALPFLRQVLEKYLMVYVSAVTSKPQKSLKRNILLKALKKDALLKQIEYTLNVVDTLVNLTENSIAQLPDDKNQQLDKAMGQTNKIYFQIKRFVLKKYPPERLQWLRKILGIFSRK